MGHSFVIYLFIFPSRAALQSPSLPTVLGSEGARWSSALDKHPISWPSKRRLLKTRRGWRGGAMQGCFGHWQDAAQHSPPVLSILQVVLTFPRQGGKEPLPQRSSTRARQRGRGKTGKSDPATVPCQPLCPTLPPGGDRGLCTGVCMWRPKRLMSHGVWGEVSITWP